jgi:hypothetical protein
MSLTGNFSLQTVSNEFGPNSRPGTLGLSQFHQAVLGDSSGWNTYLTNTLLRTDSGQLRDFTNTAKPSVSNISTSTQWNFSTEKYDGTLTFSVIPNNVAQVLNNQGNTNNFTLSQLNAKVYSEYHKDNGQTPFTNQLLSVTSISTYSSNNTSAQISISNLDFSSLYYTRLLYFNRYNNNTSDYIITSIVSITTPAPPQLVTPTSVSATYSSGSNSVTVTWSDSNNYSGMNYEIKYKLDNGTTEYTSVSSVSGQTNWDGTGTKSAVWVLVEVPVDYVQVSVRAVRSPYQTSNYSVFAITPF